MYFYRTYSILLYYQSYIINLVTGYSLYFLKIPKINAQQEKPICPIRKNWVPQNTKNGQSAKINSHKNFVPHGILLSLWLRPLKHMNDGRNKRALLELDSIFFRIHRWQVNDRQTFSLVAHVKRPTYPSPKPTFCFKWEESVNVGLGEG